MIEEIHKSLTKDKEGNILIFITWEKMIPVIKSYVLNMFPEEQITGIIVTKSGVKFKIKNNA